MISFQKDFSKIKRSPPLYLPVWNVDLVCLGRLADDADHIVEMLQGMATAIERGELRDFNVRNEVTNATLIAEKREHLPGFLDAIEDAIELGENSPSYLENRQDGELFEEWFRRTFHKSLDDYE